MTAGDNSLSRPSSLDVLIIESSTSKQQALARILDNAGHRSRIATTGLGAIRAIVERPPDVTFVAAGMRVQGEVSALRLVRALQDPKRRAPVIALTEPGEQDQAAIAGLGADAVVQYPFDESALERLLSETCTTANSPEPGQKEEALPFERASFDADGTLTRLGGDRDLLRDLIGFFFEDAFGLLAAVHRAAAALDLEALHRTAHRLKSLACNFGHGPAVKALNTLEALESADASGVSDRVRVLDCEISRLATALADYSEGAAAGGSPH